MNNKTQRKEFLSIFTDPDTDYKEICIELAATHPTLF